MTTLAAFYRVNRERMVGYAARIIGDTGAAEDAVQDAVVYHLGRHEPFVRPRFLAAVKWEAQKAARDARHVVELRNTSAGRRSRVTNTFPNQIFGCAL